MMLGWICAGLIAGTTAPASDTTPPPDPVAASTSASAAAYREARAQAGRSPEDQVKLALWCEAHGLTAERLHHLTLAVLADPRNATARGLLGLVARDGRWMRPEAIADKLKADPDRVAILADYELKRQKTAYTADAQWTLGVWASEHGLAEQAKAHLTAVTRLDPSREAAWKKLGYKKHDGRWATDAQLAAERADAEAQKIADRKWKSTLERYKGMLDQASKREAAEAALIEITDPRAVPMILQVFGTNRPGDQARAVQLLGQVDSPSASRSLAGLAVLAKSAEVRRAAIETLKRRDPRDFVRLWIALIRKPIKFEVKEVGGPGSPGILFVEGEKANLQRRYSPAGMPDVPILPGTKLAYDANGLAVLDEPLSRSWVRFRLIWVPNYAYSGPQFISAINQAAHGGKPAGTTAGQVTGGQPTPTIVGYSPYLVTDQGIMPYDGTIPLRRLRIEADQELQVPIGQMALDAQRSAESSQQQLSSDVARIEKANADIRQSNEAALSGLKATTGKEFGDDPEAWARWWTEQQGYVLAITQTTAKPTIVEEVTPDYIPQAVPQVVSSVVQRISHSCFAAGTPVRTIDGDRSIESIRAGDLVLVQDTNSGALAYQAVVAAYHNPPSPTLKVKLGESDAVVATGIHRFWKAGKGWTMARDLKAGDLVRTLGGVAKVASVEDDRVQPVFNLEVAEGHSFLVGKAAALVHDNSLVEATPAPFDAGSPKLAK